MTPEANGHAVEDAGELARLSPEQVYSRLGTSPSGLSSEEAEARRTRFGRNEIPKALPPSMAARAVRLLRDPFTLLLVFAGALAALSDILGLAAVIFAVVALNTALSVIQERRAQRAVEALERWVPELCKVVRDGVLASVPALDLVPGDVVRLEEGDRVPADARLVEASELWTNNVPLTGESSPQPRTAAPAAPEEVPLDSPNLVFMSTSVARGTGSAVVYSTGPSTRYGEIARLSRSVGPSPSPLQTEIDRAAKYAFAIAVGVGLVFFLVGAAVLGIGLPASVLLMIGVMVACVPEGLQLTISTALTISLLQMARENVLVKGLSSVQTLGSVTTICTDKTGTITKGEMTTSVIWVDERTVDIGGTGYRPVGPLAIDGRGDVPWPPDLRLLLECAALCNDARMVPPPDEGGPWGVVGDPTEGALLVAAAKAGVDTEALKESRPRVKTLPFDSVRKLMTTVHSAGEGYLVCTKGSPGSVLPLSDRGLFDGADRPLDERGREEILAKSTELAEGGLRIIAVATKRVGSPEEPLESSLTFVGLVGMEDPPRPEVSGSVRAAQRAGIRIIIVTGDYGPTAAAIAKEVGIVHGGDYTVVTGAEVERMGDEELSATLDQEHLIFARVSPPQKMRIVRTLKSKGEVVAVTGDGANDAPSLREADIGVAMGASGTDVAREAADLVLLDDSFTSIVRSVELGRGIYDNVKKFVAYVFSHNFAELVPYIIYGLLAIPLPLLAIQILAIDLIIDVPPSLALSREPPEEGVMDRPPRSVRERVFNREFLVRSASTGALIAFGTLLGCVLVWSGGGWSLGEQLRPDDVVYKQGTTMVFAGIVVAQMANLIGSRSLDRSVLQMRWDNKWILIGLAWMASTLLLIIYLPPLQGVFGTAPLTAAEWALLGAVALAVLLVDEAIKARYRWRARRRNVGK